MDGKQGKEQGPNVSRLRASSKANAQAKTVFRQSRALNQHVTEEALAAAATSAELPETMPTADHARAHAGSTNTQTIDPHPVEALSDDPQLADKGTAMPSAPPTAPEAEPPARILPFAAAPSAPPPQALTLSPAAQTVLAAALASPLRQQALARLGDTASGAQGDAQPSIDFDLLSKNIGRLVGEGTKALSIALEPLQKPEVRTDMAETATNVVQSFSEIAKFWLSDSNRSLEAQKSLQGDFLNLWAHTQRRMYGIDDKPVVPYDPRDKRFAAPQWQQNPFFDFLRQAHAITTNWADDLVTRAEVTDDHAREKARFYLRQISSALSPSNFLATNPELLHETFTSNADNLVRGAALLTEDIEAGKGTLKIRQSDSSKFELGVNMAVTPGKVVFRNDLIELIQYAPATETVYKRPLLIVPPWINKFYILDLNHDKSFVRYMVEQGLTVFMVSWVNPDSRLRDKSFEDYMREGILASLDAIREATGEEDVAAMGYCVGGTLLAVTLAYMAQTGDRRISSATFLATQTDFTDPGDLKVFVDEKQIRSIEDSMAEKGYLDGSKMATAFNMLRPNDLIWAFVVNNYVRGKAPMPFDLLTWNSDATRMTAANHSYYLRNCYLENNLIKGRMTIGGQKLDLSRVTVPVYNLATKEDHIAPAKSVFEGAKHFGGEMRYVLGGSGHIAGVVNPPAKPKYQFWTGPRPHGAFEDWLTQTTETKGSWWPDWIAWLTRQAPEKVPARAPGGGKSQPLCDAPGTYVRVKS